MYAGLFRTFARVIDFEGDNLPTEFLLLKAGVNETSKGPIIFDDEAARLVMAEYQRSGVDLAIDLNHEMLDATTMRMRRDAGDALGWFNIEMRGKDLWMVNIRWNPEGRERLLSRKQRYFSPAVAHLKDSDRAIELVNVALVARPATYDAAPLIAASRVGDKRERARAYVRRAGGNWKD